MMSPPGLDLADILQFKARTAVVGMIIMQWMDSAFVPEARWCQMTSSGRVYRKEIPSFRVKILKQHVGSCQQYVR